MISLNVILGEKMMRNSMKQIVCLTLVGFLLISTNALALKITNKSVSDDEEVIERSDGTNGPKKLTYDEEDLDPDVNLTVTVNIKEIRALDKIDLFSDPDFYVKVFINGEKYESPCWRNQKYVTDEWSKTVDVPDEEENVSIKIQLWDWNLGIDKLCDISHNDAQGYINQRDVDLVYSLKTGHWRGDDYNNPIRKISFDPSGYGRLNGCDDNSIYQRDRDCELWFDIFQNENDSDGIPYWTEVNVYETNPNEDNTGDDDDGDGVPIEWEHKWGHYFKWNHYIKNYEHIWIYDPFECDNHTNLDPDDDGLQNIEEYLTSQWGSDPFRQDIFLELDQMEKGENGEGGFVPDLSKELIRDAFGKHNIVFQVDDGCMGGGQKNITFDPNTTREELQQLYLEYFLNNDTNNWRKGTFHYALILYNSPLPFGNAFRKDSFQIATIVTPQSLIYNYPIYNIIRRRSLNLEVHRTTIFAGLMMHELGHTLGIFKGNTPGCDSYEYLKYMRYRSCMNYYYVYFLVDYSDGSRGKNDHDDWDFIDLTYFEEE